MELIQLTSDYEMKPFDCGDAALNGFLCDEAKPFLENRLARTFLFCDENQIAGYFCLLNDKISKQDVVNSDWRKLRKRFPHSKHFGSYPSVKLGRFAVSVFYRNRGLGSELMDAVKGLLLQDPGYSIFRFLTVDAYLSAIPFYEKNGFKLLLSDDENEHTRLMFFDMMEL